MTVWDGGPQPLAPERPAVGAGHVGRSPGSIDEHQAVRVEVGLGLEPGTSPPRDVRAILLLGMGRLFFHVIRRRSKKRHSVPMPADTPAFANSAWISFSVMSDFWSTRRRISAA